MGGAYSVAGKGRCTTTAEEEGGKREGKKGRERDATGKRDSRRRPQPPLSGATQPPLCSGLALLASNQDEVLIERTGHVSTIRHKIGCGVSQVSNTSRSSSQGIETSSKYNFGEEQGTCLLPIIDDGDFCPTCLDGYTEENPKIVTRCKHHYHLSCILEWKERSNKCPICDQIMVFDEV